MSKNKKKQDTLPPRPAIPYVDQIVEDIRNAEITDVAFLSPKSTMKRTAESDEDLNSMMIESFDDSMAMDGDDLSNSHSFAEVDIMFQKVEQFIQLNKQLETAPLLLKEQNERLQNAASELSQKVKELRKQAALTLEKT